ncbi:MAG: hypothetical protein WAV21_00640 [Minisyncoccia bacterium]
MQYKGDKGGSKFLLIFLIVVGIYLAFFSFDIPRAYEYTYWHVVNFFQ